MALLKLIKLTNNVWKHNADIGGDFILTKFYAKNEFSKFLIVESYGAKRFEYLINEIEVYDIGGTAETFTTFELLFIRLKALGYTGYYEDGTFIFVPADYISDDAGNSLVIGTDNKFFVPVSGGGGVASVSGSMVDNTNPLSPIINSDTTKQDALVNGTNIKTINGTTILGSGDLVVSGGGGTPEPYSNVLHLGNSICKHPITSFWWGEWGMAATVRENDYVHKFWDFLKEKSPSSTSNAEFIALWEQNYMTYDKSILNTVILASDLVVIRLGENVTYTVDYQNAYKELVQHVQTVNPNAQIILGGQFDFQFKQNVETAMINVANELQLPFVSLKHLTDASYKQFVGAVVQGDDGNPHTITNTGVADHPSDLGMLEIAKCLFSALNFEEETEVKAPQVFIYGDVILNDSHNNSDLIIKANSIITVPKDLTPYFKARVFTDNLSSVTFLAGTGTTILNTNLTLESNKGAVLLKNGGSFEYGLYGDLIASGLNPLKHYHSKIYSNSLTGTTETIMNDSTLLPIAYLDNGTLDLLVSGNRTVITTGFTFIRFYINSSHSLTGATKVAEYASGSTTSIRNLFMSRNMVFSPTTISTANTIGTQTDAGTIGNQRNQNFAYVLKNNPYIIVTYQHQQADCTAVFEKIDLKLYN